MPGKNAVHDPQVLILDEPASGLTARTTLYQGTAQGTAEDGENNIYLLAYSSELADCCNKIGIIERGQLLASGDIKSIMQQVRGNMILEIEMLEPDPRLEKVLWGFQGVQNVEPMGQITRVEYLGDLLEVQNMHRRIIEEGINILFFREVPTNLEEIFMKVTKGEVA